MSNTSIFLIGTIVVFLIREGYRQYLVRVHHYIIPMKGIMGNYDYKIVKVDIEAQEDKRIAKALSRVILIDRIGLAVAIGLAAFSILRDYIT